MVKHWDGEVAYFMNTQVKIADVDSGKALGPRRQGEVAVKGPQV